MKVLEVEDAGEAGSKIIQNEFTGDVHQLFNINYFEGQAVIYSALWPDCCLTVEGDGKSNQTYTPLRYYKLISN